MLSKHGIQGMVSNMANKSTFIKLDRNIRNWGWYQNANTFRVFIHCLLCANVTKGFFEGVQINRGEFATSYEKIARTLNLTVSEVRTAINHLKSTGEIATKIYSKFQVISILNYSFYQDKSTGKSTPTQQAVNIQLAVTSQQYKNIKNNKNIENGEEARACATPSKHTCGKFQNVLLTEEQERDLRQRFPNDHTAKIDRLSEYMHQTGKTYKDHYEIILKWAKEDGEKQSSFNLDEFVKLAVEKSTLE